MWLEVRGGRLWAIPVSDQYSAVEDLVVAGQASVWLKSQGRTLLKMRNTLTYWMVSSKTPVPYFWVEDWVEKQKASVWLRKPGQSVFGHNEGLDLRK